tara:strand:- start:974 stop:1243 length:270 start_codon:yes stop_codon:yes gene_type:complete
MPSIKNLKKDINDVIGGLIEEIYVYELLNPNLDLKKTEKLIEDSITLFDELINKIHNPDKTNLKSHYKEIQKDLFNKVETINGKLIKIN